MSTDSFDPTAAAFPGQPVQIGGGVATAGLPQGMSGTQAIPQQGGGGAQMPASAMALLHGVEMEVTVELARTTMSVKDLLALAPGRVVEMDRPASALVDVLVNGTLVARGEVVVLDDEFGVRVTEIVNRDPQSPAA